MVPAPFNKIIITTLIIGAVLSCSPQQETPPKDEDIPLETATVPPPELIPMHITVAARELNIRSEPTTDDESIAKLAWGDALYIYDRFPYPWFDPESGRRDYWYKLHLADGSEGWVFGGYLDIKREEIENTSLSLVHESVFPGGNFEKNEGHWDFRVYGKTRPQAYHLTTADIDGDDIPELLALVSWVVSEEEGIATRKVQLAVLTLAEGRVEALLPEEGLTESYHGNLRVGYRLVHLTSDHNAILIEQFISDEATPSAKMNPAGDAHLYLFHKGEFRLIWSGEDGSVWK